MGIPVARGSLTPPNPKFRPCIIFRRGHHFLGEAKFLEGYIIDDVAAGAGATFSFVAIFGKRCHALRLSKTEAPCGWLDEIYKAIIGSRVPSEESGAKKKPKCRPNELPQSFPGRSCLIVLIKPSPCSFSSLVTPGGVEEDDA